MKGYQWNYLSKNFHESKAVRSAALNFEKTQLQSQFSAVKKRYGHFSWLSGYSGFGVSDDGQISAEETCWDDLLKIYAENRDKVTNINFLKRHAMPNVVLCQEIFEGRIATGAWARSSTQKDQILQQCTQVLNGEEDGEEEDEQNPKNTSFDSTLTATESTSTAAASTSTAASSTAPIAWKVRGSKEGSKDGGGRPSKKVKAAGALEAMMEKIVDHLENEKDALTVVIEHIKKHFSESFTFLERARLANGQIDKKMAQFYLTGTSNLAEKKELLNLLLVKEEGIVEEGVEEVEVEEDVEDDVV